MPPFLRRILRLLHIFSASGAKTPAPHPRSNKDKIAPQFSQIINAALFCAVKIGNQKIGWKKAGLNKHGYGILKNPPQKKTRHNPNRHLSKPARRPCRAGEQGFLALPQNTQTGKITAAKPPVF
jgi:hypothetical protein